MRYLGTALFVVLSFAGELPAQRLTPRTGPYSVRGIVRDTTDRPIASAVVTVYGVSGSATTNDRGEFFLSGLPEGTYVVQALALGYRAKLIPVAISRRTPDVVIEMIRTIIVLDSIRTTDRPEPTMEIQQRRQDVISAAELASRDLVGRTVMDALELLRPQIFAGRGTNGGREPEAASRGRLYPRDETLEVKTGKHSCIGVRACDIDSGLSVSINEGPLGSPDILASLSVAMIREMKYLLPVDATARFGIAAGGGPVLIVYTR